MKRVLIGLFMAIIILPTPAFSKTYSTRTSNKQVYYKGRSVGSVQTKTITARSPRSTTTRSYSKFKRTR